jgi:hypothetical protein
MIEATNSDYTPTSLLEYLFVDSRQYNVENM